jgi:hypothetical protein
MTPRYPPAPRHDDHRTDRPNPPPAPGTRLALFADTLLAGLFTAVTALGVVTAYPGLVAACAVLRDRVLDDHPVTPRRYLLRLRQTVRSGPAVLVVPPLIAAVLILDAIAIAANIPGRIPLTALLILATATTAVLALRLAAHWRPGTPWPTVAKTTPHTPTTTALLLTAATTATAIALAIPITTLLIPGPLALAAITIDLRHSPTPTPRNHGSSPRIRDSSTRIPGSSP